MRPAIAADVSPIVERWLAFAEPAHLPPADATSTRAFVEMLVGSGHPILVLDNGAGPVGSVSAFVGPYPLNADVLFAQGLSLWIEPGYRGGRGADMLLDAMEAEMERRQVAHLSISAREDVRGALVERLLRRRGYRLAERVLVKEFPHGH